jgi:hypothetical protein
LTLAMQECGTPDSEVMVDAQGLKLPPGVEDAAARRQPETPLLTRQFVQQVDKTVAGTQQGIGCGSVL